MTLSLKSLCSSQLQAIKNKTDNKTEAMQGQKTQQDKNQIFPHSVLLLQDSQNESIGQVLPARSNKHWRDDPLMAGVPGNACVLFPSIRHEPDLMGYGAPSNQLPGDLRIFGYWGYILHVAASGKAWPIPKVENPPLPDHVLIYLKYNLAGCIRAQKNWEAQCKS